MKLLTYRAAIFIYKLPHMLNHKLHNVLRTQTVFTIIFLHSISEKIQTDS